MGFSKPIILEIAYKTYAINEYGMAACFALLGKERGLLIDTGCGMCNMKEHADRVFNGLPYDVVLTHSHGDHSASMDYWDQVYIHPADIPAFKPDLFEKNKKTLHHYPEMMARFGSFEAYDVKADQIRYPERVPVFLPVENGSTFDLGGRIVTVLHMPGHTPGEIALIDPFSRIAFTGDACNVNLGLSSCYVSEAMEGMERLNAVRDQFDRNFNGHIGYGKDNFNRSMPEGTLDDCLYILNGILTNSIDVTYGPSPYDPSIELGHVNYGTVHISFDPNKIQK